jgi:hypothetical protein
MHFGKSPIRPMLFVADRLVSPVMPPSAPSVSEADVDDSGFIDC